MRVWSAVSRAILLFICIWAIGLPRISSAQDDFGRDDIARHLGYGGYTTYHQQFRSKDDKPHHPYEQPQPIVGALYGGSGNPAGSGEETRRPFTKSPYDSGEAPTRIETFYRDRTGIETLRQFGYELFNTDNAVLPLFAQSRLVQEDPSLMRQPPMGTVQSDYILQSGDEIAVIFMGERKDRETYTIGSDGRLLIDNLQPVTAAGRTLGSLRQEIGAVLSSFGYKGEVNISVSGIRQIGVLVAGHVGKPGRQNMNAFHSVIDALHSAGGIEKTGSLRQIRLIRSGQTETVDLYALLIGGRAIRSLQLRDGDRIIVPPLGPTIAITGDVKQPGIFELLPDPQLVWRANGKNAARAITLNEALTMSGGLLSAGDNRFTLRTSSHGRPRIINISAVSEMLIGDGGILTVTRTEDLFSNAVELKGYSRKNGLYDLDTTPTLSALLGDHTAFGDDIYPLIGVIARIDRETLTRTMTGFSPQAIALGENDRRLEPGDTVYLFSRRQIDAIMADTPKDDENKEKSEKPQLVAYRSMAGAQQEKLLSDFPELVRDTVRDTVVTIQGAVRNAGAWPVGESTDLKTLISVAGGLTSKASRDNIEIVSGSGGPQSPQQRRRIDADTLRHAAVTLHPGDQVRINKRYEQAVDKSIRITGEIRHPGTYDLMRGDTLLSVIERAGGLTPDAYPPGAIFSRLSERRREEAKFRAAAQDLERTISVNLNAVDKNAELTPRQIMLARDLAQELRAIQAVGRVTVEADPAVLSVRPELNLLVEGGDHLHIPKRPLNVRVSGEVMNPATLLFTEEKDEDDYIAEAGGATYYADKGRIFVLYPDGSAQPLRSSDPVMIIPGSTIVVPRDPKPFNFMDSFKDITQILTNMAITGVFVEDIATDGN